MAVTSETTTSIKYQAAIGYATLWQEGMGVKVEVNYRTDKPEHLEEFAGLLNNIAAAMKEKNNE